MLGLCGVGIGVGSLCDGSWGVWGWVWSHVGWGVWGGVGTLVLGACGVMWVGGS